MSQLNQQQNRYLESPFVIRDTNPDGQFAFGTVNNFGGGVIFKKDGFSMPSIGVDEQRLGNETEDNSEPTGGVKE